MKLVVNTNSNICRIYHYIKNPAQLTLLKEISHPENKLKNSDLTSDGPGHYQGGESSRGAYSPHTEAKDVLITNFAKEIAKELNQERMKKEYNELILISAPHMMGLLLQQMDKNVKELITNKLEKDLVSLSEHELLTYIQTHQPSRV